MSASQDSTETALQSNTFQNIYFDNGAIGYRIGNGGYMGSENIFLNCFFGDHSNARLSTENFNALQNMLVEGKIQACGKGIHVSRGSVTNIVGVGFQQSTTCDIQIENGANDAMAIQSCRSESESFAVIGYQAVSISGCC